jgi:hypothetical protein
LPVASERVRPRSLPALTAAKLLASATLVANLVRRRRRESARTVGPRPTPERPCIRALECDLYVEAEPQDRSLGTVKGFAIALASRERRGTAVTYLLVNDPSKPAAVWVKDSEIRVRSLAR